MDLSRYPEILLDLLDKAPTPLMEKWEMPAEMAREIVFEVCEVIRREWAGNNYYIGKGFAHNLEKRDMAMYKEFNGSNHRELAKKNDITVRQVYERLELVRVAEFNRKQGKLFD